MNRELLAAVLAEPDSDEPRIVLADWIEENGQGERAEFIRVQCRLAAVVEPHVCGHNHGARGCWVCRLRRRERELLEQSHLWLPFLLPGEQRWFWGRGFIERFECTASDWCAHADAILACQPVREVTLTTWPVVVLVEVANENGFPRYHERLEGRTRVHDPFVPIFNLLAAEWPQIRTWQLPGVGIAMPETSL